MYLIVGTLFGISISLFYIFLYSGSVFYGVLCGIIGFVVIGLIQGLIVIGVTQLRGSMLNLEHEPAKMR